jgi:Protein kinase domain
MKKLRPIKLSWIISKSSMCPKKSSESSTNISNLIICSLCLLVLQIRELPRFFQSGGIVHVLSFENGELPVFRRVVLLTDDGDVVESPMRVSYPHQHSNRYKTKDASLMEIRSPLKEKKMKKMGILKPNHVDDGCELIAEWQSQLFTTCNTVHEHVTRPIQMKYLARGSISAVFRVVDEENADIYENYSKASGDSGDDAGIILKASRHDIALDDWVLESRRKDAIVAEHHTGSPFFMSIYSHCGSSIIAPLADGGSLYNYLVSVRSGGESMSPIDKLKVATQMVGGVAALHDIPMDQERKASIIHNDLDPSQFVYKDGIFHLNDFNLAQFIFYDNKTNEVCPEDPKDIPYLFLAPEDLAYHYGKGNGHYRLDKAEVFSLGAAIYMLVTNRWMWEKLHKRRALGLDLIKGKRPAIPTELQASEDPAIQALLNAIHLCWIHDPGQRAAAVDVFQYLKWQLGKLLELPSAEQRAMTIDQLRVSMPPLIKNSGSHDYESFI